MHLRVGLLPAALALWSGVGCGLGCQETGQKTAPVTTPTAPPPKPLDVDREAASHFAGLALRCVQQEFPNKLDHVMSDQHEVQTPRQLHPSFFGCFDWHSAVHGHWLLVHLLKRFPDLPEAGQIRAALNANLGAEQVAAEVVYLQQANRRSFERTYGWAWLLKLAEELHNWPDADGMRWSANLAPLAAAMAQRYREFLPRQTYPIRRGVHPNTAFGIAFALDYAREVSDRELEALLLKQAGIYFRGDTGCPAHWEPDGDDFFSRCLMEADLMRRVQSRDQFTRWFRQFLPATAQGLPKNLIEPAVVADRSDPKIVHLDGLNLSRAWNMYGVAAALPEDAPERAVLLHSARRHLEATLTHVASGDYVGEHWLATFAVYALSGWR